ncbi:MAG TPA: papain-like cysteine protease family protein [Oligoflexus sp.]|uniref:papain-like cysteine protease family protein n=1 Tax=Oligoflexus sp. TaxID=1971216 RepID=UPI002D3CFC95|nr:papain-like cysteine protease family protein [Oligoflexus sp.]HYX37642.1 papain-like cysteine protease family protein [Oligoflexus sp.]
MKKWIWLFALALSLTPFSHLSGACDAKTEISLQIDVVRNSDDQSLVCAYTENGRFVYINSVSIWFSNDSATSSACDGVSGTWTACAKKSLFYASGTNSVSLGICTLDPITGGCSSSAYVDRGYLLSAYTENGIKKAIIRTYVVGSGAQVAQSCTMGTSSGNTQQCLSNINSAEFLEKTMANIQQLTEETEQMRDEMHRAEAAFNKSMQDYYAAKKALDKPVEQLTNADFANFEKAQQYLQVARKEYDRVTAQIKAKETELRDRLSRVKEDATKGLVEIGIDPTSDDTYKWIPNISFDPIVVPPVRGEDPIPDSENVFKILADKTLEELSANWTSGDRRAFLETVYLWTVKSEQLLQLYKDRLAISSLEQQAYLDSVKRIEAYLYGANGQPGYLDANQWFVDNVLPAELRDAVDVLQKDFPNDRNLQKLKQLLNTKMSGSAVSSGQLRVAQLQVFVYSFIATFRELSTIMKAAQDAGFQPFPAPRPPAGTTYNGFDWDSLTAAYAMQQGMFKEIVEAVEWGTEMYIGASLASPLVSLCRVFTLKRDCDPSSSKELNSSVTDFVFDVLDAASLGILGKVFGTVVKDAALIAKMTKSEASGLEMLITMDRMGLQTAEAKQLMRSAKTAGLKTDEDVKLISTELKATAAGASGDFDALGRMNRHETRAVLFQGRDTVTCGPASCSMVLNTLTGKDVTIETLVSRTVMLEKGTKGDQLVQLLKSEGVSARWNLSTFPKDLETLTAKGRPVIVKVKTPRGDHWKIVDGVTTRAGRKVAAIRDPAYDKPDGIYFELWETFSASYLKEAVIPNP